MAGSKEAGAKARQTMIDRYYDGDEQKYIEAQRARAAKGGAKGGRPFRDTPGLAKKASDIRTENMKARNDKDKSL